MNIPYLNLLNSHFNGQLNPQILNNNFNFEPINSIPSGLQALYMNCYRHYPDQYNPLQISTVRKFWLGGQDPLDYISLYNNPGDPKRNIPSHWHYISFGLSDLYGDLRVHQRLPNQETSGFGFELTFRLKKDPSETTPPFWPANILQSLAKYVFQTNNIICSGDHVSENKPLDNGTSKIEHMLMTEDPQLGTVPTPLGKVTFIQIVGVTNDELKASQQWNVNGIIELMKKYPEVGGEYLVTDMQRQISIFELNKDIKQAVDDGITKEGSNLSGVSARCSFRTKISIDDLEQSSASDEDNTSSIDSISENEEEDEEEFDEEEYEEEESEKEQLKQLKDEDQLKKDNNNKDLQIENEINNIKDSLSKFMMNDDTLKENNSNKSELKEKSKSINNNTEQSKINIENQTASNQILSPTINVKTLISPIKSGCSSSMSVSHDNNQNNCTSSMSYTSETGSEQINIYKTKYLNEVHIFLNLEAGLLLPLVLRGRLKHNHHFTYKSTELAITFLTPSVSGSCVTIEKPFASIGPWLQILLEDNLVEKMIADLEDSEHKLKPDRLPKTFFWDNLAITITAAPED